MNIRVIYFDKDNWFARHGLHSNLRIETDYHG